MFEQSDVPDLPLVFPQGFGWGTATASYQIEGAVQADGRSTSIWDTFSHTPGTILDGTNGDRADDHYHRWAEDVDWLAKLGAPYYRFSLAWPRLQPDGKGALNPQGVDFYSRLVDALLERGITPWVTAYHWDMPQVLEDEGGWPVRDTVYRFADYAEKAFGVLGDRVQHWTTLNEPYCSCFFGYADGQHAPGRKEPANAIRAMHNLFVGHGLALKAWREAAGPDHQFGISLSLAPVIAASEKAEDVEAARRFDGLFNRLFLAPLFTGHYPADVVADLAPLGAFDGVRDGDMELINQPLDALGVNYYSRKVVRAGGPEALDRFTPGIAPPGASDIVVFNREGWPVTAADWEVDPEGLFVTLDWLTRDYGAPALWVTENGSAWPDLPDADGRIRDVDRIAFLRDHFTQAARALEAGIDLRGYFVWTLMDNFEWGYGESRRFGLLYVDYETQERVAKDSFDWFARVIANGTVE